MAATHLSGPLILGTDQYSATANAGYGHLTQAFPQILRNATLVSSSTIYVPANTQVTSFTVDVLVAFDSATSATLSIGYTAGGTELVSGVNVKAATGRIAITFTPTQLTNMSNITTNTTFVATVTSVGQPTVGTVNVTCFYSQKP